MKRNLAHKKGYYDNTKLKPFSTYLIERYTEISMSSFAEKYHKEVVENMKEMFLWNEH